MEYDQDKVDEMVLALLSLTMFEEDQYGVRAWKGHDWVAMDRLHAKGYISDPKSKAKSVVVAVKGVQRCRELFEKHFEKKKPEARQR
jgi:hypothetical protein